MRAKARPIVFSGVALTFSNKLVLSLREIRLTPFSFKEFKSIWFTPVVGEQKKLQIFTFNQKFFIYTII